MLKHSLVIVQKKENTSKVHLCYEPFIIDIIINIRNCLL